MNNHDWKKSMDEFRAKRNALKERERIRVREGINSKASYDVRNNCRSICEKNLSKMGGILGKCISGENISNIETISAEELHSKIPRDLLVETVRDLIMIKEMTEKLEPTTTLKNRSGSRQDIPYHNIPYHNIPDIVISKLQQSI